MKKNENAWTTLPVVKIIGKMMFDPVWSQRFHRTNGLELIHVLRGCISVSDGKCIVKAGAGDIVIIPSDTIHKDDFMLKDDVEAFFCSMDWAHEPLFLKLFGRRRRPLLISGGDPAYAGILENLGTEVENHRQMDDIIAGARLMTILLYIYREKLKDTQSSAVCADSPSKSKRLFEDAKDYISRHYAEHLSLEDIAAKLNVSPYHLSRVFSRESDYTLFAFLSCVRMRKARVMLADERKNVAETAYAVGFEDPHYFSKVFKNHYHCSPSEFVARQRKADFGDLNRKKRRFSGKQS